MVGMEIVCVGDSLTRAQVSADYVDLVRAGVAGATVVRSGVNFELSGGLVARLDEVIERDPAVVTVLIGTNDVRYGLSGKDATALRRRWKLTGEPSAAEYRENLRTIAGRLRAESRARVALLSLPVIGEELGSVPVLRTGEYSEIVRAVAAEQEVDYLPLHEKMTAFLRASGRRPGTAFRPGRMLSATAAIQHFVLRRGFDAISRSRGLQLTTDTVHLNSRGAGMIAELIRDYVRQTGRA
jgi:lysophospholipase L1-like esterase